MVREDIREGKCFATRCPDSWVPHCICCGKFGVIETQGSSNIAISGRYGSTSKSGQCGAMSIDCPVCLPHACEIPEKDAIRFGKFLDIFRNEIRK